jgi:hypothetical protein
MRESDVDRMLCRFFGLDEDSAIADMGTPAAPTASPTRRTGKTAKPLYDLYVLHFSGHGRRGTGDWALAEGETYSFAKVLGLWRQSRAKARDGTRVGVEGQGEGTGGSGADGDARSAARSAINRSAGLSPPMLLLVLDHCHAGCWVQQAIQHQAEDVAVQAACSERETTTEGSFTRCWLKYQRGEASRAQCMQELQGDRTMVGQSMTPCSYRPWKGDQPIMSVDRCLQVKWLE